MALRTCASACLSAPAPACAFVFHPHQHNVRGVVTFLTLLPRYPSKYPFHTFLFPAPLPMCLGVDASAFSLPTASITADAPGRHSEDQPAGGSGGRESRLSR
eukprot:4558293-Pleurochrysis_carterae.AAC.2